METNESLRKDLKLVKALSFFEGVCFFVAGICAVMAGSLFGYISGGLMIVLACMGLFPVFFGGDRYFLGIGESMVEDEDMDKYIRRMEDDLK